MKINQNQIAKEFKNMNINIALCDDDPVFVQETEQLLLPYIFNSRHEIHLDKFLNGDDLIRHLISGVTYDIYLLDIEIADANGIDVAREINKTTDKEPYIIFISNYPEYMQDSFAVHPYYYLQKPIEQSVITSIFDEIIGKEEKRYLSITILDTEGFEEIPINIMNILCIETTDAKLKRLKFHFFEKSIIVRGTISEWTAKLNDYPFFLCYKGILVNVYHIHYIKDTRVVLKNGEDFPISRKYINQIKNEMVNVINTYII